MNAQALAHLNQSALHVKDTIEREQYAAMGMVDAVEVGKEVRVYLRTAAQLSIQAFMGEDVDEGLYDEATTYGLSAKLALDNFLQECRDMATRLASDD